MAGSSPPPGRTHAALIGVRREPAGAGRDCLSSASPRGRQRIPLPLADDAPHRRVRHTWWRAGPFGYTAMLGGFPASSVLAARYGRHMVDATKSPDLAYIADLTRVRAAAGAVLLDEQGHVMVVYPTYKDTCELPGGSREAPCRAYASVESSRMMCAPSALNRASRSA